MCFPDDEHDDLLTTIEALLTTLLASLRDVNQQLNTLDGHLFSLQRDNPEPLPFQGQQHTWEPVRSELTLLRGSLELALLTTQQQRSRLLLLSEAMPMASNNVF
ncbi:MAG: hypothetical protein M3Y81_19040 [Chloroflexota bacterium]|nr:hypothetical protein [Chloroflexota bacterium]